MARALYKNNWYKNNYDELAQIWKASPAMEYKLEISLSNSLLISLSCFTSLG